MKDERGLRALGEFAALGAIEIGEEDKSLRVDPLQEHHPDIRKPIRPCGRECHRVRIVRLRSRGLFHPAGEQSEWIGLAREIIVP